MEIQHHHAVSYDGRRFSGYGNSPTNSFYADLTPGYRSPPQQYQGRQYRHNNQQQRYTNAAYDRGSPQMTRRYEEARGSLTPTRATPPARPTSLFSPMDYRSGGMRYFQRNVPSLVSDESHDESLDHGGRMHAPRSMLPSTAMDSNTGTFKHDFEAILNNGLFESFAKDKPGCHHLQETYPAAGTPLRTRLFSEVFDKEGVFEDMCKDVFANFFIQKMIEESQPGTEQHRIATHMEASMHQLCMNRYSCRVVQKAIEILPDELKIPMVMKLDPNNLAALTVDQNANHVIQKILNSLDVKHWEFIVRALMKDTAFFKVVENKYGCRVIQLAIEKLCVDHDPLVIQVEGGQRPKGTRERLLTDIMSLLLQHCERLSSNEFANYVIQHVIQDDRLSEYRDQIIESSLLCKLLSLSQEKYASHVVEKAMKFASPVLLREMLDEVFDGYVPHPETKKDALDILLFHQFGNYVVQRMLDVCMSNNRLEKEAREHWLKRLEDRIHKNASKLSKYSSGKKILETLRNGCPSSFPAPGSPMLNRFNPGHDGYRNIAAYSNKKPAPSSPILVPNQFR